MAKSKKHGMTIKGVSHESKKTRKRAAKKHSAKKSHKK